MFNTRIAPSPTGDMHLGTARTSYFNYLAARASGGKFILRIDDTDINRNNTKYVDDIINTMDWLGLDYDKLIYQHDKFDRYISFANILVNLGLATTLPNGAISLNNKIFDVLPEYWTDEICGTIKISDKDNDNINNMILIKGDGSPSYNWSCVIDDHDCNINYIIRGNDHLSNTAKQIALYYALSGNDILLPKFAHIGLIHHNKKKLSKRDGAASMLYYKEKGYDPDAILNFMLRLGWAESDGKVIKMIDKEMATEIFLTKGNMRNQPSNMDLNMLENYDRKYKAKKGIFRNKDKLIVK